MGDFELNTSEIVEIKGVTDQPILSLGFMEIKIYVNNLTITHKFHIMPIDFNIPSDGIIGKDFIKLYSCILDYGDHTFTIRTHQGNVTIAMNLYTKNNEMVIPARSEVQRIFKISVNKPSVITSSEISPGIFTANVIVRESGEIPINIVNTTDQTKILPVPTFESIDLNKFMFTTQIKPQNPMKERTIYCEF